MSLGKDMKRALFVHLQTLSFSYYNVTPVGYMLSRVMNDTGKIAGLIAWNFVVLLRALTYVLGVFVAMFFLTLEACPDHYYSSGCSGDRSSDLLFPEPDPEMEPAGT